MIQVYVGDVHSQHNQLLALLHWVMRLKEQFNHQFEFIFLGDLFDSRMTEEHKNKPPYASATQTLKLVQQCMNDYPTVVLQSNHQDKLRRYLKHRRQNPNKNNPVTLTYGLAYTVEEFLTSYNELGLIDLETWLEDWPYLVQRHEFDHHLNTVCTFNIAHAYYNTCADINNLSAKHKSQAIYGLLKADNSRAEWWLNDKSEATNNVFVSGHYHVDYMSNHSRIIDAGCGGDEAKLIGYIPALGLKEYF